MAKFQINKKSGAIRRWKFEPYGTRGKFESWDDFVIFNETQDCNNPACTLKRHGRGKHCRKCSLNCTKFGDPRWRAITPKHYRQYIDQAKEVIAFNPSNIVITDFIDKVTTIADQGKQGLPVEWAKWWADIHDNFNKSNHQYRNSPHKMLAYFVGAYIFYEKTRNEFIKTERMWHYLLADIALWGVKTNVKPKSSAKRMHRFGKYLWEIFSIYFIKIGRASMRNDNIKRIREQKLADAELKLPMESGLDAGEGSEHNG
jgi:hypothetical protein